MAEPLRPRELFEILAQHGVQYVVVGGLAAVLHGSPTITTDLDICPEPSVENLQRLSEALEALHARIRTSSAPVPFTPAPALLRQMKMLNLSTDAGSLDLTFEPSGYGGYEDLVARAVDVRVGNIHVLVASLDDVIRSKEIANRDKDRAVLPVLYALRDEIAKREPGS